MRFALAILPAALLTGCIGIDFSPSDRYQADFHYNYDLQPGAHINLENINGSVEITGWDEDKVEINGARNASTREALEDLRIDIHNTPSSIDIRTVRPSGFGNAGARYTLRVPRSAILDRIATSNGQLQVRDLDSGKSSSAYLKSSNGSVRVENLRGAVDVQTSNASVELSAISGDARAKTSNGRIRAEDVSGECDARTSNGSIAIDLNHAPESRIRAETSNGSITVRLPGNAGAHVVADTSNSSIRTDFDPSESNRRNHLNTTLNGGGPLIELTTRNGSISVLRR